MNDPTLTFGSLAVLNAVRREVVAAAIPIATNAPASQVGFGFKCLGYNWDAKRAPVEGKWMISHNGEFFTDIQVKGK